MTFFNTLPDSTPKYALYEQVLYGGGVCQVMGYQWWSVLNRWTYDLGSRIGNKRMIWHREVREPLLEKPDTENVVRLRREE